ncbi:MAG: ATP-binding protein [Hyphomicrobiaceae bacterium]
MQTHAASIHGEVGQPAAQRLLIDDVPLPFADTRNRSFSVGLGIVILSLISALASYLILTNLTPLTPRGGVVLSVLAVNGALILAMFIVIAGQGREIYRAWREGVPGARLHIRIVGLFSLIAALPALLLAIAATTTFTRAIDGPFSDRTRAIVQQSTEVANIYFEEHGQIIRTDAINMARDLDDAAEMRARSPAEFQSLVLAQAGLRDLPVAYVIDASGRPLITAIENERLPYRAPPANVIELATSGQVPLLMPSDAYRVAALVKLQQHPGLFLFVARGVSPAVLRHMERAQAGLAEFTELRKRRTGLQVAHGLLYFMIALSGLLAAIWTGLWFAGRFVAPIGRLISAAQHVSRGNLAVELPIRRGEGDLRRLSQTFNTMTNEIKAQRDELVATNTELVERRRFTEAVLAGVSAGVIGLDHEGEIRLVNTSAEALLHRPAGNLVGSRFEEVLPELAAHVGPRLSGGMRAPVSEALELDIDGHVRVLTVRVTREDAGVNRGAVVTFDDMTELVNAQRASAWADVAQRIAHEIKNPLTPIQLSAERLKRKYGRVLTDDREVFDKCTDTIIRQVGAVSRMVDEFRNFARMPEPKMVMADLRTAVRDPVTLFQMGTQNTDITLKVPDEKMVMALDPHLIDRVITNIVKNAAEAVQALAESDAAPPGYVGRVEVEVFRDADTAVIEITDNGTGLDKQQRARLLEPYVTTKAKGTGLGLAIVQKIVEQHAGSLVLDDAPETADRPSGARVRIELPIRNIDADKRTAAEGVAAE